MGPREVRIQADARLVIAFPSSRAPVSRHAGKWERPVRPDQVDGQDRTALPRTATANNCYQPRQLQRWPVVCEAARPNQPGVLGVPWKLTRSNAMKSHKRNAVLAIMIAVAAIVPQVRAIAAESQHKAAGAKSKGSTAAAAAGSIATAAAVPPALSVTPATLSFEAEVGSAAPPAQSLAVSSGSGVVNYSVSTSSTAGWLSVKAGSGKTPGSISISADPAGLPVGTYSGTVTVASSEAANSPIPVAITLTVAPPALTLAPTTLSFTVQAGGMAPAAQLRNHQQQQRRGARLLPLGYKQGGLAQRKIDNRHNVQVSRHLRESGGTFGGHVLRHCHRGLSGRFQ